MNKNVVISLVILAALSLTAFSFAVTAAEEEEAPSIQDQIVQEKCTLCHSGARILTMDPDALKATLERMQKRNPDWITDIDNEHIAEVLTTVLANPSVVTMRRAWQEAVERGEALFSDATLGGGTGPACAKCHQPPASLKGVHDAYPRFSSSLKKFITLEDRINRMIVEKMKGQPIPRQDERMTDLVAYIKSLK